MGLLFLLLGLWCVAGENKIAWTPSLITNPTCLKDYPISRVYVRVYLSTGMIDPNAKQSLEAIVNVVPDPRIYIIPTMKVQPEAIVDEVCEKVVEGVLDDTPPYVVVNSGDATWSSDTSENREYLQKLMARVEELSNQDRCYNSAVNIMTTKHDWEKVFGNDFAAGNVLIWDKTTGTKSCSTQGFAPFGGWTAPYGVLYDHDLKLCDMTNVDVGCRFGTLENDLAKR